MFLYEIKIVILFGRKFLYSWVGECVLLVYYLFVILDRIIFNGGESN